VKSRWASSERVTLYIYERSSTAIIISHKLKVFWEKDRAAHVDVLKDFSVAHGSGSKHTNSIKVVKQSFGIVQIQS
jgi:hypothetical protein